MRSISIAFGLVVAIALPVAAHAAQDPILAPGRWTVAPPIAATQNPSWRTPLLSHVADPSPGPSAVIANGFSHPLRYSIGTEWAVRAAVVALQATGHVTSGQRRTTGDSAQQAAVWPEPLLPPINVKTGSSQTAF
jgi:hypothetical protein